MTIAPPAEKKAQEYFGIVLHWVGGMYFRYAALRKAGTSPDTAVLGVSRPLFRIFEELPASQSNFLEGKLGEDTLTSIQT